MCWTFKLRAIGNFFLKLFAMSWMIYVFMFYLLYNYYRVIFVVSLNYTIDIVTTVKINSVYVTRNNVVNFSEFFCRKFFMLKVFLFFLYNYYRESFVVSL